MAKSVVLILCILSLSLSESHKTTAYGYHLRVGVPKAVELLKYESAQSRIIGGQVAAASAIPHQVIICTYIVYNCYQSILFLPTNIHNYSILSNFEDSAAFWRRRRHCLVSVENQG